ncbi:hypothetical protein GDO81_022768 [Engystomops pustulosus]|uniref:Uncharacterized protein n=1 Tax=Engystomops pustulosus TaxID=76066 RepID=A0AAV6YTY6_ENGPU|nr:hypothetical protein GDO81_022768 [Engystomops pustulosus]
MDSLQGLMVWNITIEYTSNYLYFHERGWPIIYISCPCAFTALILSPEYSSSDTAVLLFTLVLSPNST